MREGREGEIKRKGGEGRRREEEGEGGMGERERKKEGNYIREIEGGRERQR